MLTAFFFVTVCAQEASPTNDGPLIPLTPNTVRRLSPERPGNPPPPSESGLGQTLGSDLTGGKSGSDEQERLDPVIDFVPKVWCPQPQRPR